MRPSIFEKPASASRVVGKKSSATSSPSPRRMLVRTTGEFFPGGSSLELILEAESKRLALLFCNGAKETIGSHIEAHGRIYVPAEINPSLLRATVLPNRRGLHGSTAEMFAATRDLFTRHGFSDEVAFLTGLFGFSTWFPEAYGIAPCLLITGPPAEAFLLLQLLECVVRHPLRVGEIDRAVVCSVPTGWQPTILIDHASDSRKSRDLLVMSSHRGSHLPWKGGFADAFCAKAVYCGVSLGLDDLGSAAIRIRLAPIRGRLPILDAKSKLRISEEFQPKFLDYRVVNYIAVGESQFDLPDYSSGIRISARVLAGCIVGAPEIQDRLAQMLQAEEEILRAGRWRDERCIAIASMIFYCHTREQGKVYIGEIAKTAETIGRCRGEGTALEARKLGHILRSLGFHPQRDVQGFSITLTEKVCRQIHEFARDYDVAALRENQASCNLCLEFVAGSGRTQERNQETKWE